VVGHCWQLLFWSLWMLYHWHYGTGLVFLLLWMLCMFDTNVIIIQTSRESFSYFSVLFLAVGTSGRSFFCWLWNRPWIWTLSAWYVFLCVCDFLIHYLGCWFCLYRYVICAKKDWKIGTSHLFSPCIKSWWPLMQLSLLDWDGIGNPVQYGAG
jgi:hypothetical protein